MFFTHNRTSSGIVRLPNHENKKQRTNILDRLIS